jgi:hypothetical protein
MEHVMSKDESETGGGEAVQAAAAAAAAAKRKKGLVTGVAVGVGSAALVAALLYANRSKRDAD